MRRHAVRLARAATTLALLAALAVLWPARLGGRATYVSTHGSSMVPGFHQGDLVAVRPSSAYRVGDIVAYRSRLLHTVVLHRIVRIEGGRFVFKGDNNTWLDAERPASDALIGRLWVHVPRRGPLSGWSVSALAVALATASISAPTAVSRRRGRRPERNHMRRRELISASARPWCSAAIALAAAAAAFAALGAYAIAQPTTKQVRTSIPYTQRATFGYTAPGPALVYPGGQLRSGDPVYLRLVPAIDVTVTSVFDSAAPRRVSGTTSLRVDVSDGTGWHESMELAPPAPFQGTRTEQTARLDLASLQGRLAEIRAATGVANTTYNLDIVADIHMTGTLDGHRLDTRFAPHLPFQLDTLRLAPITSASEGDGSALARSAAGHLAAGHRAPRRFEFGGGGIPIHDLRRLALIAAVAGAIAALAARRGMNRRLPDDAARTALRHRSRLVGVTVAERHAGGTVFDVAAIDDLVRLADQHAALILHERTDAFDVYQFEVGRTTYRLRQPRPRGPRAII